jgi:hypothetical protein
MQGRRRSPPDPDDFLPRAIARAPEAIVRAHELTRRTRVPIERAHEVVARAEQTLAGPPGDAQPTRAPRVAHARAFGEGAPAQSPSSPSIGHGFDSHPAFTSMWSARSGSK